MRKQFTNENRIHVRLNKQTNPTMFYARQIFMNHNIHFNFPSSQNVHVFV